MSEPIRELLKLIETNRTLSFKVLHETLKIEEKELGNIIPLRTTEKRFPDNKTIMDIISKLTVNKTIKKSELKDFESKFYEELDKLGYSIIHVKQGRLARILVYMEKKGDIRLLL